MFVRLLFIYFLICCCCCRGCNLFEILCKTKTDIQVIGTYVINFFKFFLVWGIWMLLRWSDCCCIITAPSCKSWLLHYHTSIISIWFRFLYFLRSPIILIKWEVLYNFRFLNWWWSFSWNILIIEGSFDFSPF